MKYIAPSTVNTLNWISPGFGLCGSLFPFVMNLIQEFRKRCRAQGILLDSEGHKHN